MSDYYSVKADEMRALATAASTKKARDEFLKLAQEYDALSLSQALAREEDIPKRE